MNGLVPAAELAVVPERKNVIVSEIVAADETLADPDGNGMIVAKRDPDVERAATPVGYAFAAEAVVTVIVPAVETLAVPETTNVIVS